MVCTIPETVPETILLRLVSLSKFFVKVRVCKNVNQRLERLLSVIRDIHIMHIVGSLCLMQEADLPKRNAIKSQFNYKTAY